MATGGVLPKFKLPCGIEVEVTKGDIFQTKACALVTGEDKKLKGEGGVSKGLKEKCPKVYASGKEHLKKTCKSGFQLGRVYPVRFPDPPNHTGAKSKKSVSFGVVYHAIVPNANVSKTMAEWRDTMRQMYYRLLKAVDADKNDSLALPLLGSGGACASYDEATDILTEALTAFRRSKKRPHGYLKEIYLYIRQKEVFDKMISKLAKQNSKKNGSAHFADDCSNLAEILKESLNMEEKRKADKEAADEEEPMEQGDSSFSSDSQEDDGVDEEEEREEEEEEKCAVCLDEVTNPKKLDKCGHTFCTECIDDTFKHHKPACPTCNTMYGLIEGNQPRGTMRVSRERQGLPGYRNCGMLIIDYEMPSGIQGKEHPNPGLPYHGTTRRAFLPDCEEGKKVYRLLRVAFENRLVFTVGTSRTTGRDNVVTWNDIHHKTNVEGGATHFAYPDPHYLSRVQEELAAKGVTEECLKGRSFDM